MNRRLLFVTITLVLSFSFGIWLNAVPHTPNRESLASFPRNAGAWTMSGEDVLDDSTTGVLQADDYLLRRYRDETGKQVELFIAYYKTQKAGESMHSPKNCLPGSGWEIERSDEVALREDEPGSTVMINRYLIDKNGEKALVLYWYQASGRVIASEYWGKIYLVLDAIRTNRRDGAIVRFVVSIPNGSEGTAELESGLALARTVTPLLPRFLPD